MKNVDELFNDLIELGQHPKQKADTVTILEKIEEVSADLLVLALLHNILEVSNISKTEIQGIFGKDITD